MAVRSSRDGTGEDTRRRRPTSNRHVVGDFGEGGAAEGAGVGEGEHRDDAHGSAGLFRRWHHVRAFLSPSF